MTAVLLSAWLPVAVAAAVVLGSVVRNRDLQVPIVDDDGPPPCEGCSSPICPDHPWQPERVR
jgi:hypothetical protein